MLNQSRALSPSTLTVGAAAALAISLAASGCARQVVPVAPVMTYEQQFVSEARRQGDFSAANDADIVNLGNQVCDDLDYQPDTVPGTYYDYFVMLSVQYICPEHQSTIYQLGY